MQKAHDEQLLFEWPIDLGLTVMSHGWYQLAPWDWALGSGRLRRRERIGERLGTISIAQGDPRSLTVTSRGFAPDATGEIARRVRRWISADWDPAPAIAALALALPEEAALIRRGGGRILRCSSFYEDFVKTVLTINTSWAATLRMTAALVSEAGGDGFPTPAIVLEYGEARLRERAKLGFRAATVIRATERMLADGAIDAAGDGDVDRLDRDYLLSLHGIGPYAAAHCRLLLQDFRHIPIDTVAVADLRQRYGQDPAEFAVSRAECGDYLALGYRLSRLNWRLAQQAST